MSYAVDFLAGLGPAFILLFTGLTGATLYQIAAAREHARGATDEAERILSGLGELPDPLLERLSAMEAAGDRARLSLSSVPTTALLGTCAGFYNALVALGAAELGSDSLALLELLMDSGVSSALATTVAGQALYFLLGQVWSMALTTPVSEATVLGAEALARLRAETPTPPLFEVSDEAV